MQIILICLLTLCTPIFSQSLTFTSAFTATTAGFQTSTLGVPQPPEDFDLTFEIGGPKLRITSCLMNAVAALKELALRYRDSKIIDGTEYRLASYPEVSIIITTAKPKGNMQARLVLWAVCSGMYEMIMQKKFEFAQIEISRQKQVLGWVQVVNHPNTGGLTLEDRQANGILGPRNISASSSDSNHAIELNPVNITTVITLDDANDAAEARLNVTFEPYGEVLSIYDVFVPIISGLTDMAKMPSTYQPAGLILGLDGFEGFICAMPILPIRTSPPFLDNGWLIRTVARIPAYMLDKSRFGEIVMKIAVDEVVVGFGRLSATPRCNMVPPSAGVAES